MKDANVNILQKVLFLIQLLFPLCVYPQSDSTRIDTAAIYLLDHMSAVISELNSCSYNLEVIVDEVHHEDGLERQYGEHEVHMSGPDKMLVQTRDHQGHRGYWYNGEHITYYNYDENNFVVVDAPSDIISMIEQVNKLYGLEFPAADFFYPTFTDDILQHFDSLIFLGNKKINGKETFHIMATAQDMDIQIWVSNDALNLPVKYLITYKEEQSRQYEATFTNWQLNPDLPPSIFKFIPPPGARLIEIQPKAIKESKVSTNEQ